MVQRKRSDAHFRAENKYRSLTKRVTIIMNEEKESVLLTWLRSQVSNESEIPALIKSIVKDKFSESSTERDNKFIDLRLRNPFFRDVKSGVANFIIRSGNDLFKLGDLLTLHEYENKTYSGDKIDFEINCILKSSSSLKPNYVLLGNSSNFSSSSLVKRKVGDVVSVDFGGDDQYTDIEITYVLNHEDLPEAINPGACLYSYRIL